ncbi:MAG: chaperone NapD [Campylobacter sp.]|nr:chaperone NapD [Campylobacter sp.]
MNISSLVIYLKDTAKSGIVQQELVNFKECEVIAAQYDRIVVVVSAKDIDDEIKIFKKIEAIEDVASAAMVYSYQEDAYKNKEKLESQGRLSEILSNDNVKAEDICYGGSVNHKVK